MCHLFVVKWICEVERLVGGVWEVDTWQFFPVPSASSPCLQWGIVLSLHKDPSLKAKKKKTKHTEFNLEVTKKKKDFGAGPLPVFDILKATYKNITVLFNI